MSHFSLGGHESSSVYTQFKQGWKATLEDSKIWRIGLTQALSEGAMDTFVFMWVPTLLSMDPPGGVSTHRMRLLFINDGHYHGRNDVPRNA